MAKQLETSLDNFSRRESPVPWIVLSAIIVVSVLIPLVLSATAGNWLYTGLLSVAFVAAIIFSASQLLNFRRTTAKSDRRRIDWETAQPDIQRQNLHLEVFELSRILEVESDHISDLQTAYIVAEDLALRQIQQEENVPLLRHVTIGKTPFEAVMVKDDVITCIDVSFLVIPDVRQEKIDAMMRKIEVVKNTFADMGLRMKVRLMVVLVTQLAAEDDDRLRLEIKNRFKDLPAGLTTVVSILDFESLQKIYVTE